MEQKDFNTIYLEMQDRVYRLAVRITGDSMEAEDVVQDLYERLWRKRLLIKGYKNLHGYILTSARNLCLDRIRARKPVSDISPTIADEKGVGEEEREMGEIIGRLISELPEKQRTVIHLRDVECMEIEQIAKIMGIKDTAIRMSLSRARSTVKEQMVRIMNYGI